MGAGSLAAQEQEPAPNAPTPLERAGRNLKEAMQRITVPKSRLTDGPHVRAAFRDVVSKPSHATVRIRSNGNDVAVGGIVGCDGWILTKASSLDGSVTARLKDGRELDARIVGIDESFDLAVLKVDATDLPVLDLARDTTPSLGQWIAAPGIGRDPLAVGVVSVQTRPIPRRSGILGVLLGDDERGPRVDRVFPKSGAAMAGILVNDVVKSINGEPTKTRPELIRAIRQFGPEDEVIVGILRGKKELSLKATLSARVESMRPDRGAMQNQLGSKLSKRRYGFPTALQHDAVLRPKDCGGPLIDLDGRTIGFNIARGGRTESYAIPAPIVVTLLYDLMSGNLAPEEDEALTSAGTSPQPANPAGFPPEP